ncbi:MAG TPA: twin-arginine translocase TatA/TatE family subunit [Candidatus Acidoferrales bacterium]|nr:twin-arginine translocase TatA/TatE family subunit [Candidatus Acidoferrales bacterium]
MSPIFAFLSPTELAIIVGIAVLLFGADRIPKLARSMGQAKKEFEAAQRGQPAPQQPDANAAQNPPQPPAAPQS